MKKPILYMMVGIPASGKSTVAKEYASKVENSKVFSSDEYRKNLLGDEQSQENNALVFKTLFTDMHNWLSNGNNAIFDACNTTVKSRRKVVDKFSDIAVIVPVVVGFILNENVFDLALVFKSSKCKSVPPDVPAPLQEALPPIV